MSQINCRGEVLIEDEMYISQRMKASEKGNCRPVNESMRLRTADDRRAVVEREAATHDRRNRNSPQ
jgi:hypothetical protein